MYSDVRNFTWVAQQMMLIEADKRGIDAAD
jgi:hypothetical protein